MKAQKKVKSGEIIQPDTLTDLVVPAEHAQQAIGGTDSTSSGRTISQPITYTYTVNNTSSSL